MALHKSDCLSDMAHWTRQPRRVPVDVMGTMTRFLFVSPPTPSHSLLLVYALGFIRSWRDRHPNRHCHENPFAQKYHWRSAQDFGATGCFTRLAAWD